MCDQCGNPEDLTTIWGITAYDVTSDKDPKNFPDLSDPYELPGRAFGTASTAYTIVETHAHLSGRKAMVDTKLSDADGVVTYIVSYNPDAPEDHPTLGFTRHQVVLVHRLSVPPISIIDRARLDDMEHLFQD